MALNTGASNEGTGTEGRPARAGRPSLVKRLTPPRKPPHRNKHGRPKAVGHARETGDRRLGYMLVAPVVILLLAITAYPLIYNIWNAFHFDNLSYGNLPHNFVGWKNFTTMFDSPQWVSAHGTRSTAAPSPPQHRRRARRRRPPPKSP